MFDAKRAIPGVFYAFPKPNPKSTLVSASITISIPNKTSQDTIGIKEQSKQGYDTDLDPNLEPPKDLNLMFRDQLGVGDEVTG
jgi:hypothetical protein